MGEGQPLVIVCFNDQPAKKVNIPDKSVEYIPALSEGPFLVNAKKIVPVLVIKQWEITFFQLKVTMIQFFSQCHHNILNSGLSGEDLFN